MNKLLDNIVLKWKRFKSEAKIPTKRITDVGYDIYTIEDNITIAPHSVYMFSTGLGCYPGEGVWLQAVDRGSTGSRGLHTMSGIIDEQYTGEIFIAICNTNDYPVTFTSEVDKITKTDTGMLYPVSKAICQIIPWHRWYAVSVEATDDEWEKFCAASERGDTKLGQSGK